MRVAVVGAGIAGLAAALRIGESHRVTLFDPRETLGGHANTVDVRVDGMDFPVDTGFLVYNERTYPNLVALFAELEVPVAASDMSFSVSVGPHWREWCGSDLASVFAQPSNLLRPRFWRMLRDILRFNREATALALAQSGPAADPATAARLGMPLGEFLDRERYSAGFRDDYLLPMAAAIWSCPIDTMRDFPVGSFVRFFHNHGLLQVENRPQWFTVRGGSREYVARIRSRLQDVRAGQAVLAAARGAAGGVQITTASGTEHFDEVVFACHPNQTLELLRDASAREREILGAIRYQPNRAILHTDPALLPKRRRAWAAWNYFSRGGKAEPAVSVSYLLNRLQPLPCRSPVMVTLNPLQEPDRGHVLAEFEYEHPVFDRGAVAAQQRLHEIQGLNRAWFAGAWTCYGFHEDGLRSGLDVARELKARAQTQALAA